jgi:hypothetical protein
MKPVDKAKSPNKAPESSNETESPPSLERTSYARELRALGQSLEVRHMLSLDLELEGGIYRVRGGITASKYAESSLSAFVQDLVSGVASALTGGSRRSVYEMLLCYKPEDIAELDAQGRAHRRNAHQIPDPYSLSQKLRGVGSFLDDRLEAKLAGISIEDRWVTVRYRTAEGRLEQAKQDVAYFYNYWVKMYLRRSTRESITVSDESPVVVRWGVAKKQRTQSGL